MSSAISGRTYCGLDAPEHEIAPSPAPSAFAARTTEGARGPRWRLGIDVATLAAGLPLDTRRWLNRAPTLAHAFSKGYAGAFQTEVWTLNDGLVAIGRKEHKRAVVIGHPLWRHDERDFNSAQADAYDTVQSERGVDDVMMSDVWVLQRLPAQIYQLLANDP